MNSTTLILKGDARYSEKRAFGVGNEIARAIKYLSTNLIDLITIDELTEIVGMSRAIFHKKFKQATEHLIKNCIIKFF